jgi:hypothetical protein
MGLEPPPHEQATTSDTTTIRSMTMETLSIPSIHRADRIGHPDYRDIAVR